MSVHLRTNNSDNFLTLTIRIKMLSVYQMASDTVNFKLLTAVMHLSIFCPPGGGGGGHTRGFRQKTIPDRREFDKLMESGSRVI